MVGSLGEFRMTEVQPTFVRDGALPPQVPLGQAKGQHEVNTTGTPRARDCAGTKVSDGLYPT